MCDWVLDGLRLLVGLDIQALFGLDLVPSKVVEMISYTNESKPLVLPWGRTLVRRKHVVKGDLRKWHVPVSRPSYRIRAMASDPRLSSSSLCLLPIWLDQGPIVIHCAACEMDLFAFIRHADPTKVRIGEGQIEEGQVPLLESTEGHVIPLVGRNEQGGQNDNVDVAGAHELNEESGGAEVGDQTEEGDHVVQGEEVNIVDDEDVQATVADKPKRIRKKRKAASGASGSNLPPKKLREDHGTSVMSVLVPLGNPLPPFRIYLIVALWPQKLVLRQRQLCLLLLILTNVSDDEVTSIIRSSIPPPSVMTIAVAAIAVAGTYSVLVPGVGTGLAIRSLFANSTSPKFNVGVARQACFSAEFRLSSEHIYRERKKFERKCDLLKEKDAEIANLKAQLSLKEAEAAEAIRILEGQVTTLESAASAKEAECASLTAQTSKLTQDLSSLQLSFDELNVKAISFKSQKDNLVDQVSSLETICSGLRDQISDYELFKEQYKAVQDE
ncbi:hypothetical protein Tco_0864095 [Tanacetum coccineum]